MADSIYTNLINDYLEKGQNDNKPTFLQQLIDELNGRVSALLSKYSDEQIALTADYVPHTETSFGEYVYGFLEIEDIRKLGFKNYEVIALTAKLYLDEIWERHEPEDWKWFLFKCLNVADLIGKAEASKATTETNLRADEFIERMTPCFVRGVPMVKASKSPRSNRLKKALENIVASHYECHQSLPTWREVVNQLPEQEGIQEVDWENEDKGFVYWTRRKGVEARPTSFAAIRDRLTDIKKRYK